MNGQHVPETEAYGISSFVYRARRPFHPKRIAEWLESEADSVLRAKGYFWLASRPAVFGVFSIAGVSVSLEPGGYWYAHLYRSEWPEDAETLRHIQANWDEQVGDRRQELVFIGTEMDRAAMTAALDACLLTPEEMRQPSSAWVEMDSYFPQWDLTGLEESAAVA